MDVALHFRPLETGPLVQFWSPAPLSESTWRTGLLRYSEPHTLGLTNQRWEEMVVSLRRWWCPNCASDSLPGCTGRELLHGYASCRLCPGRGFVKSSDGSTKIVVRNCRRSSVWGTILTLWARIKWDVKGQAGTSRFSRRGLSGFKGTDRKEKSSRGCASTSAPINGKFTHTHTHTDTSSSRSLYCSPAFAEVE